MVGFDGCRWVDMWIWCGRGIVGCEALMEELEAMVVMVVEAGGCAS